MIIAALIAFGVIGWSLTITNTYIYGQSVSSIKELTPKEQAQLFLYEETLKHGLSFRDFRILEEIIRRESQWDINAKNINKNGSKDIGLFQINMRYWTEYGRELDLEFWSYWKDNIKLGVIIYKNYGTTKWVSMR